MSTLQPPPAQSKRYILNKDIVCAVRLIDLVYNVLLKSGSVVYKYSGVYISNDSKCVRFDSAFVENTPEYFSEYNEIESK